jgi:hypothetical protein
MRSVPDLPHRIHPRWIHVHPQELLSESENNISSRGFRPLGAHWYTDGVKTGLRAYVVEEAEVKATRERKRKAYEVVGISFARGMVARIDAAAVRSGTNRSALVRAGVDRVLETFERPPADDVTP